nr:unnamed protein product [Callosobruchus chinensis]
MTTVLQGNLGRSRLAQDLLVQMAHEHRADVLIISEQYKNSNGRNWFSDRTGTAAIWVRNSESLHISKSGEGDGFVWVRINNIILSAVTSHLMKEWKSSTEKWNALRMPSESWMENWSLRDP